MRLTKKTKHYCDTDIDNEYEFADEDTSIGEIVDKLGQLEDLMEKYGIDSIEELEDTIQVKKALELAFGKRKG